MDKRAMVALTTCLLICSWKNVWAQQPPAPRLGREIKEQQARISGERVSRQTEVLRLEQMIERLEGRVNKLERALLGTDRFPSITVVEAAAALRYAQSQMEQSERQHAAGEVSKTRVEADKLKMVRARTQLKFAKAARQDRLLELELAQIEAQRRLLSESNQLKRLESLVAKGFGAPESLQLQRLKIEEVQAELFRTEARLELHQNMGGDGEIMVENESAAAPENDPC